MSRDARLFLLDMRTAAEKVLRCTHGLTQKQFMADEKTYDAALRNLEIIGEAVRRVPEQARARHPEVKWRQISGFRNVVAHEYFGVDEDILWDIISNEVPVLLEQVRSILAAGGNEE